MVSALWNACSEGDLSAVVALLETASSLDIEIKDHTGVTPLIQAVQNGHVEVVRALLDKGADPANPSSQGRPEQYTSDPTMQELLASVSQNRAHLNGGHLVPPRPEAVYSHDTVPDPSQGYYTHLPGAYYFPGPPPPLPDGAVPYYPPQSAPHLSGEQPPNGFGNLPPPEIARLIPCRYFPACRYGASCMFAHPQGQYITGPIPPHVQYPIPYDPMSPPYPPQNYYGGSPPTFSSPNNAMNPMAGPVPTPPHPPIIHTRHGSEIISPIATHFSPQGPAPIPFGPGPMSPTAYPPHSAQVPVMSPLPPLQHPVPPPPPGPQQGPQMYPIATPQGPMPSYPMAREGPYHPQIAADQNVTQKSPPLHPQGDSYINGQTPRDGINFRRGNMRKPPYINRKPPCLFFPSGRCRNGNECRFPHVMPETNGFNGSPPNRIGPKPRYPLSGVTNLENNIARMNLNDDDNSSRAHPSTEASSPSHSTDGLTRSQGFKPTGLANGPVKRHPVKPQRVPTSDEFPTLGGPSRSPGPQLTNGHNGLTAAQVLQAPPPSRRESTKDSSLEHNGSSVGFPKESNPLVEANGKGTAITSFSPALDKIPLSFAAATTGVVDASKELTVSA